MDNKNFKVSGTLMPFVIKELKKNGFSFYVVNGEISVSMSGNQFHKIVLQAMCQLQRGNSKIPVLTAEQAKERQPMPFHVLKREKYLHETSWV